MDTHQLLDQWIEKAVAFAHAAADEPTSYRIWEAQTYSAEALSSFERQHANTPSHRLWRLLTKVRYLRALLLALERQRLTAGGLAS